MAPVALSFYGVKVEIRSDSSEILHCAAFDFSWFVLNQGLPDIRIEYVPNEPPKDLIPPLPESARGSDYVCFDDRETRYVKYSNGVVIVHKRIHEEGIVYAADAAHGYEKLYLFLMSRVGEKLDSKGFARVHGCAFRFEQKGVLVLAPMGGGKSTLTFSLMKNANALLLSEDAPLLTADSMLHPFPLRVAVESGNAPNDVPQDLRREFVRTGRPSKMLVHIDYFKNRISKDAAPLTHIFTLRWTRESKPSIRPIGKIRLFRLLIRDCVFGFGLPQVVEFFLRGTFTDSVGKALLVAKRTYISFRATMKVRGYELRATEDREANAACLLDFLR